MPVCDTYRLQAYVDGQLGDSEARAVETHLAACEACARLVRGLRMVVDPLRVTPEAPPEGLHERLLAAVVGLQPLRTLDCSTAQGCVCLQLDGELSHEDCQRLVAHLDTCGDCARAASETELTARMLRSIQAEGAPLGLLRQIQRATEECTAPARRPDVWRRWAAGVAGVAAAAALVLGVLSQQPQSLPSAPLLAQNPAIGRVAQPSEHQPLPTVDKVASVPASGSAVPHTETASAGVAATPRMMAAVGSHVRSSVTPARPSTVTWSAVAPTPAAAPENHHPVAMALAPARTTEPSGGAEVAVTPSVSAEAPVAPAAHEPESPSAVRLAAADTSKATPVVEVAVRPAVNHHRPTWVSRPTAAEREVYASEDADTRLADARTRLKDDARRIVGEEVKGFIIR